MKLRGATIDGEQARGVVGLVDPRAGDVEGALHRMAEIEGFVEGNDEVARCCTLVAWYRDCPVDGTREGGRQDRRIWALEHDQSQVGYRR